MKRYFKRTIDDKSTVDVVKRYFKRDINDWYIIGELVEDDGEYYTLNIIIMHGRKPRITTKISYPHGTVVEITEDEIMLELL